MKVVSVNRATAREVIINGRKVLTAIGKQSVEGHLAVGPLGIEGDEQADLSVHGGLGKAVYAYPLEHYAFWQTVRAQAKVSLWDSPMAPGSMGENLTVEGMVEDQLWIGDRLKLPSCVLAVSKLMVQSGYCGSYLAVIEAGQVCAGDPIELIAGPREVNLRELFKARARA